MSNIQFEEDQEYARRPIQNKPRGLIALVQKWGLAKNDRGAQYVLLGVVVGAIFLAILIHISFDGGLQKPLPWQPPSAGDIPPGFTPHNSL